MKDHLNNGDKALDVGCGSGYLLPAMLLLMKNQNAQVYGIEHIQELVDFSKKNITK